MYQVYDDDWRLRPIVFYDTLADAKAAGVQVFGEQEVEAPKPTYSEPFLNIPGVTQVWPDVDEMDWILTWLHILYDIGMPVPVCMYCSGASMELIANGFYGLVGWTCDIEDGETIGVVEGIPLIRNDLTPLGDIFGYWNDVGPVFIMTI
jgi:hypothetical protein